MKTIAILNPTMRSPHSTSEWNDRFKIENFNTFFSVGHYKQFLKNNRYIVDQK